MQRLIDWEDLSLAHGNASFCLRVWMPLLHTLSLFLAAGRFSVATRISLCIVRDAPTHSSPAIDGHTMKPCGVTEIANVEAYSSKEPTTLIPVSRFVANHNF